MKKYFIFIVMLLASAGIANSTTTVTAENQKVSFRYIDRNNIDYREVERSIRPKIVEASYNTDRKCVECEVYNIGEAYIYIIDSTGTVRDEIVVETDIPTIVYLSSVSCNGSFYVIVESTYVYAEGIVYQ